MPVAYELREAYAGTVEQADPANPDGPPVEVPYYTGGVITAGDRDINVRAELDAGNGTIIVPDTDLAAIIALDEYSPLKRTTVPDGDVTLQAAGYDQFTVENLRQDPRLADVAGVASARKGELVAALEELDRRSAAGDSAEPLEQPITIAALTTRAAAQQEGGE
jgi:hypothetical protein